MITPSHGLKLGGGGGGGSNPAIRALAALTLIAALAALILHAAIPANAQSTTDYDTDGDGLIEIRTIAQLHGIRYDGNGSGNIVADGLLTTASDLTAYNAAFPNRDTSTATLMGCPGGACTGYELMDNLDFATATTSLRTWARPNYDYRGILEGNGYTISNLRVTVLGSIGLFSTLDTSGVIRNVGLVNPTITGRQTTGGLAGVNSGTIVASYVSGGAISANGVANMGGLVGHNGGAIIASYSTASVSTGGYSGDFGGLVGRNQSSITASYAVGAVTGTGAFTDIGGLAGDASHASSAITDSYCGDAAGQANCIGNPASSAGRYTAAQLQTPTTYTGIYANWNVDLNSDDIPDNPWNFGATSTYPVLYTPAQRQTAVIDYDADNDNLIDVDTLHQLNAIRWDLDGNGVPAAANTTTYAAAFPSGNIADTSTPYMGCESTCEGYELTANLDFAADGVAVTSTDPYPNWTPIGGVFVGQSYAAEFNGNGHTITRLTITGGGLYVGLFGTLDANGVIRDLGMIDASVSGSGSFVGILAGINSGDITSSYIRDGSVTGTSALGGNHVGGVTGRNRGTIRASYSTASVNETSPSATTVGGLVGRLDNGTIIASYAAGPVSGAGANTYVGGIVGSATGTSAVITDSYCDTTVHGTSTCIGANTGGSTAAAAGYTTAELQTPTGYTGIFANWNLSVDGDAFPDNPWNFGATSTYPALKTPTQRQAVTDYDSNNNNLIDIDSPHQLNAIRHDLNGDGLPASTGTYAAYAGAFPGGDLVSATPTTPRMGCPQTCTGYELTGNINFAADGIAVTSTDPYPNWTPIGGSYAATFDGKGNTINHLTITGATGNSGLFNTLATGAVIRDVGMVDASIGNDGADARVGVLAGDNDGGMIITSYASAGAVTVTGTSTYGGGLLGRNAGDVRAVYATAAVNASSTATSTAASPTIGGLIGLHAGSVTASYAAGAVTGSAAAIVGGFAGAASSTAAAITNGYCDTDATGQSNCIGTHTAGATATSTGYTTTQLQTPTGYTGIYESWNIPLGADNMLDDPWNFRTSSQYPTIKAVASRTRTAPPPPPPPIPPPPPDQTPTPTSTPATSTDPVPGDGGNGNGGSATSTDTLPPAPTPPPTPEPTPEPTDSGNGETGTSTDTLPPPLPRTIPPEPERGYDPAADHPEIYANDEYGMAATCQTHNVDPETGNPRAATVTFDLGSYTGPVLLHLSIWRNGRYMAYETQGIALPTLERDGQRATLQVETDPAQTRFRLDGRRHGLASNLLLGYANCDTDDP